MPDLDGRFTVVVLGEDFYVPFVLPPAAELAVPLAGQHVEEPFILHAHQGEEVLVAEVALEGELFSECGHGVGTEQRVVQCRVPHTIQIQQEHARVEALESTILPRLPDTSAGILAAVLPELVAVHRLQIVSDAHDVVLAEQPEPIIQLRNILRELEVGVEHDHLVHGVRHDAVHPDRDEEQSVMVVRSRLVAEVLLHGPDNFVSFLRQIINFQANNLKTRCAVSSKCEEITLQFLIQNQNSFKF